MLVKAQDDDVGKEEIVIYFEACYEKKLFKFQDVIVRSKIFKSLCCGNFVFNRNFSLPRNYFQEKIF